MGRLDQEQHQTFSQDGLAMAEKNVDDILKKYERKLEDEYGEDYVAQYEPELIGKEYEIFRR